ncbi:class III cytochrome C family protein [Sphingobium subterraneum]|uniref:Class III cytochrome C family protein n=1 Tax=Sphingobium subterraneum TaxID=627688 RepID=A0A841JAQ5_9SPHN|nr:class III cytochrome C family protein [Sphingobium subterraneum]MBB6125585.1 hypothetical protein [Sphingobium subterraneum]
MKPSNLLYLALGAIALFAAIAIPVSVYRSSSAAAPRWVSAVEPGPLSKAHAFLENKCESCHTPNSGVKAQNCITCHAAATDLLMKPATAFHAKISECAGCHVEHQGFGIRPTKMDHGLLERIAIQKGGSATTLDCLSCHAPIDRHKGYFGKDCASCHQTSSWKIPGYLHPSPRSTECSQCHKAPPSHYMMHFQMMDQPISGEHNARVDQCYSCHQTDSFNNIKRVGMVKVH